MGRPGRSLSLWSFCLLTSILGLERKFAPGMKDSGTWELFTVQCGEGILKILCSSGESHGNPRVTSWEGTSAHSPTQTTIDRSPEAQRREGLSPGWSAVLSPL